MAACYLSAVQNHGNLVPFLHIGSTGNDLDHPFTDIHLADDQFVGIGMLFNGNDLADHDLLQIFIKTLKALDLCSGQSHGIGIFLSRYFKVRNVCFDPG